MITNLPFPTFEIYIFLLGTIIGSFLNVVIFRVPQAIFQLYPEALEEDESEECTIPKGFFSRFFYAIKYVALDVGWSLAYIFREFPKEFVTVMRTISHPPSQCGSCSKKIAFYDNLPILSWFILKGQCRHCKSKYSFRYPLIEALTGGLFLFILTQSKNTPELLFLLTFTALVWAIFWIDFDHQYIFNVMTYPSIFLGIVYNVSKGNLSASLWGGLSGFIFFEVVIFLSIWLLKKEGMGGGDTKLAIVLGVWLGPKALFTALALSFLIGTTLGILLLFKRKESQPFPFGPAMVLGGFAAISIGENLWTWYIRSVMFFA